MSSKMNPLTRLLSQDEEEAVQGEVFDLIYRGSSEIDRHYTKPMLPWIISEVKNQHKMLQVTVTIKDGSFKVQHKENKKTLLSHTVKQIHKCVMEQADHRCFLYTLRSSAPQDGVDSPCTPLPCNISADQNYQCHLYQALTEQEVRSFFCCLRQQPRESKIQDSDSLNALADLSVHTESQFFEVLFVGRVKVSHCKVPVTFIDEALDAFRQKEMSRQRHISAETKHPSSPNRLMSFQQEGSGYSVPNIVLRNLYDGDGSGLKDLNSGSPDVEYGSAGELKHLKSRRTDDSSNHSSESDMSRAEEAPLAKLLTVEPFQQRVRTLSSSGDGNTTTVPPVSDAGMRSRSGSIGSLMSRNRNLRPSESDLKALGYDFNRTMLFHIGHREIQLINPELKSVQLHKPFKDVSGCCQGIKANDHFGFICRELSGETMVYVGYIFRCDKISFADEIMQVLNRSFSAMHEAHQKERKEHLMCDYCPLKWFSQLCAEVEGLPAAKAHAVIIRRVNILPEEERDIIIAKYEGAETSELAQKNNVLMMLLRTHFEYKQMNHSHPSESTYQRTESMLGANLEESLKKARKSITTSFSHLLKKREGESAEREVPRLGEEHPRVSPARAPSLEAESKPPLLSATGKTVSCVLEGISDSPLKPYRNRSSTISGAGGDSMRKELIAKKAQILRKESEEKAANEEEEEQRKGKTATGLKMNMFLKFGPAPAPPPSFSSSPYHHAPIPSVLSSASAAADNDSEDDAAKPVLSFRQSILQTVVSPSKGGLTVESPSRKISTGILNKHEKMELIPTPKRSREELMIIWKKSIFQQILLLRIERENQRLRAFQKEVALQRVRLNYEDEELPVEAQQAWELMLSRPNARIDSNVLYSGVKQGVPKLVRGEVWHLLMTQQQMFHQAPRQRHNHPTFFNSAYEDMLKELTSQQHAILIDLGRTFPGHPYFTQTLGPGQLALFNILKAYSILDQEVGYCQGLSFVGGVLLMHVEEEEAYHLLKYLMFDKGCRKQYRPDLDGLQIRMYQLSRLVHDKLNDLYQHLEEYEVTPQLYAAPWFLTLFASQFPISFVSRVFDLLFMFGMEAVFCVALVLLQTHEQVLLSIDSFEQIMDYFKTTVSSIQTSQQPFFFAEVCDCNVKKELSAYEVEYQVLQEELFFTPQQDASLKRLKEANKNLKRQNLDLLEDLQSAKLSQKGLETSNQSLQQSQHHLEVRVRWLEMERTNMRQLIALLCRNATKDMFDAVPANLERYLPHKASSPMPEDRRYYSRNNSPDGKGTRKMADRLETSPPKEISFQVPRQHSFSPIRTIDEQPTETPTPTPVGLLPSDTERRPRSNTLDPKSMQTYFRKIIRAD